jgi:hypothetical protein
VGQIHHPSVGEQELVSALAQVLPKLETELPQDLLEPLVKRLLEISPGLAFLVLPVTVVTSMAWLVGQLRVGVGVV